MAVVIVLLLVAAEIGISLLIGRAAERKNRSRWSWFFISLLISPVFAAIGIACMAKPSPSASHGWGVQAQHWPARPAADRPVRGAPTEFGSWVQACLNPDCPMDHVALPIPSPRCPSCGGQTRGWQGNPADGIRERPVASLAD
jgi:hypothetical protein